MIERFQGTDGRPRFISALLEQIIVHGDTDLANSIANNSTLTEVQPGTNLITQGAFDSEIHFIISGFAHVLVNGRKVAERTSGHHVGEMALIDPTAKRSATVKIVEQSVVATMTEADFTKVADKFPKSWRRIAVELSNRLRERAKFHRQPNEKPMVFIGSSGEMLTTASQISEGIRSQDITVKDWTEGIFEASSTTIESLMDLVKSYDFGVIVFGPDDIVQSRGSEKVAPRDNVIFELGLLMGGFGRERTFIVKPKGLDIKIPSDLLGVTCLEIDELKTEGAEKSIASICDYLRGRITEKGPR